MSTENSKNSIYIICDNIRSLFNVGSIFRTADGVGDIKKIFLTGITGYPKQNDPNWTQTLKISKTALGAEKYIPWEYHKSTLDVVKKLKQENINIYALENNIDFPVEDLSKVEYKFPLALVIGNEVKGIDESILKLCDKIIHIPMKGAKESLNVSVASAIALFEITKHLK